MHAKLRMELHFIARKNNHNSENWFLSEGSKPELQVSSHISHALLTHAVSIVNQKCTLQIFRGNLQLKPIRMIHLV